MADDGGIISPFKFVAYKIDKITIDMYPSIDLLESMDWGDDWKIGVNLRKPEFHKSKGCYLVGVSCKMVRKAKLEASGEEVNSLLVEASAVGLFSVDQRYADKEIEQKIIFFQCPTLLFPYLRGTITSSLANAGFGSLIIPLINMNDIAKRALEKTEIIEMP